MWFGMGALLCGCAGPSHQPPPPRPPKPPHLVGSVHGTTYTSAEGGFSVPFPVRADLAGRILTDGPQAVTFIDNWGRRITFAGQSILENSPMMSMLDSQGREKALTEFAKRQYSDLVTVHYHPEVRQGMISFIDLRPASPKAAVAIFVHGRRLFIAETEMLPGVSLLAQGDEKSQLDQESWLESWAVILAQSIQPR